MLVAWDGSSSEYEVAVALRLEGAVRTSWAPQTGPERLIPAALECSLPCGENEPVLGATGVLSVDSVRGEGCERGSGGRAELGLRWSGASGAPDSEFLKRKPPISVGGSDPGRKQDSDLDSGRNR